MNHSRLEEIKQQAVTLVEMAQNQGAHTAVATINQATDFELEVRHGDIENLFESDGFSVGLTVSRDHKRASVSSTDLGRESLEELVSQAMAMCRYTDSDPFYCLPEKERLATETIDLDIYDPGLSEIDVESKIRMVVDLERRLKKEDPRLKSEGASLSTSLMASAMANSLGFSQANKSSAVAFGVSAFAEDTVTRGDLNKGRKQSASWFSRAHHLEDLESIDTIAQKAATRVLRKLGARKPETGNFPVYYEPSTAKSLWNHLLSAMMGGEIYRNESYLVDRVGTEVCSPLVQLWDEPLLPRGLGSRYFDNEGVRCRPLCLIRDGVLQTYLMGSYSAKKLGLHSTGHSGGHTNVIVRPGRLSEEEILREMGTGVWITQLFGHGTSISTGDYSRGAQGLWVENGQVAYPIMEFTLNSQLDDMFRNISLLGNNVFHGSSLKTPGLLIGEMTVSGT